MAVNANFERPSAIVRQSSELMTKMIVFLMSTPIKCYNSTQTSTLHMHFVQSNDEQKIENDQCVESGSGGKMSFYWPIILKEHHSEAETFIKTAQKFLDLCEESVRPIRCCNRRGRSNWYVFYKGMFGHPRQMGQILAKTFDGEHRWVRNGPV